MKKLVASFFIGFLMAVAVAVSIVFKPYEGYRMEQAYGTWYGIHEMEHNLLSEIYRLNENGTFEIESARYDHSCGLRYKMTTMGMWGLDAAIFFMIEQNRKMKEEGVVNNRRLLYEAFKILKLDEDVFVFARDKQWLSGYPKFSKFQEFHTFRTKDALKKYFETDVGAQWSVCTNIIE